MDQIWKILVPQIVKDVVKESFRNTVVGEETIAVPGEMGGLSVVFDPAANMQSWPHSGSVGRGMPRCTWGSAVDSAMSPHVDPSFRLRLRDLRVRNQVAVADTVF